MAEDFVQEGSSAGDLAGEIKREVPIASAERVAGQDADPAPVQGCGPPQTPPEKVLQQYLDEQFIARFGSLRPSGEALVPLIEGLDAERLAVGDPDDEEFDAGSRTGSAAASRADRSMVSAAAGPGRSSAFFWWSDFRLLGVMGAPLVLITSKPAEPLHLFSIKGTASSLPFFLPSIATSSLCTKLCAI